LCVYTSSKPDASKQERALQAGKGLNVVNWDLTSNSPVVTPGSIFSMASLNPAKVPTGQYKVRLIQGNDSTEKELTVKQDPRWKSTDADLKAQYELTLQVQQSFNETHEMIRTIRNVSSQSNDIVARAEKVGKGAELKKLAESMNKKLRDLEAELIQTKHKSYQDPINYPPKFDDQLAWLYDIVQAQDARPTQGCYDLYNDLQKELDGYKATLNKILETDVRTFNDQVLKQGVGGVVVHNQ
jgi:hypothetical protein